jgi:hypothetical protein
LTNPNLAVIVRRFSALVAASVLPAGALLLSAGRRDAAIGLCFGALIGMLNTGMLARRINRSVTERVAQAQRVMQQGMGIRFALILLATVVIVKTTPAGIPTYVFGLVVTMALAAAVGARALLGGTGPRLREIEPGRDCGLRPQGPDCGPREPSRAFKPIHLHRSAVFGAADRSRGQVASVLKRSSHQ